MDAWRRGACAWMVAVTTGALMALAPSTGRAEAVELSPGFKVDGALLRDAQKEGAVVFWCSLRDQECALVSNRFTELTKVKAEFVRISTGPTLTRLSQERASGIYSVDVISHSDQSVWEAVYKQKKWLVKYTPEGATHYAKEFQDPDGYYFAHFLIANGLGYNAQVLTGKDIPRSYADLLDPRFKNKVVMPSPKYSGGFAETIAVLARVLGWDYFEKLQKNGVMVKAGSQFALVPIVESGERVVAIQGTDALFLADAKQGKPGNIVYPTEGTVLNSIYAGLMDHAPHPNAGKLFLEWLHSAASQSDVAAAYWLVPHPDAKYPSGRVTLKDIKVLTLSAQEAAKATEAAKERFADLFGG